MVEKRSLCSRNELVERRRRIQEEEEEEEDDPSPSRERRIRHAKHEWFADAFYFLDNLPKENHIWCGYADVIGPLLETFHNYYNDKNINSPLKLVWKRICLELQQCTECISQHHQAQKSYSTDYEPETVGPLLEVLQCLDEERVTEHLKEISARVLHGQYNPEDHSAEVVSLMFEVLSYPSLFNSEYLVNKFQNFIKAIEKHHELSLAGSQHYPGAYALLFLGATAHNIGYSLASYLGKMRRAADLDSLQPFLKKYIGVLETEVLPSAAAVSKLKVQNERINIWLGMNTLLNFLEPPAFEEGILEKHPVFLSIVLNHVSDDTPEFQYAVSCLRVSFEMLGCKLWLRTSLSPSMIRNTLLGQCFHTHKEKSHKDIFDVFLPFLQSLEALQDGEHEKQRRHFLYFLLHQVTQSSNFSHLMRKTARKIALLIVHRGYRMNPPCPPSECAHMWAPALVSSLQDTSLHDSLRQPAFDLVNTIVVSDAAAMISLRLKDYPVTYLGISAESMDEEDEVFFSDDAEEKDNSIWSEFSNQCKAASSGCEEWLCIPMLWVDMLTEVNPSMLPVSFSKAIFWAVSHIFEMESYSAVYSSCSIQEWVLSNAGPISSSFGWQVPSGSDDGGDGRESKNSVKASLMLAPLLKIFRRLAAHFAHQWEQKELQKQWTWEPRMSESLILMLADHDDIIRTSGRVVLEHVSKTQGLTSGLQFLCSSSSSLYAIYLGLRYKIKQIQVGSISSTFHSLHHVFFISRKLLNEVVTSYSKPPSILEMDLKSKFVSEGGFLRLPSLDLTRSISFEHVPVVIDMKMWEKFSVLLSKVVWPCMLKLLEEGKVLIDNKSCEMTCVRLLETIPTVFERLFLAKFCGNSASLVSVAFEYKWLRALVYWGKSSIQVIIRHWKKCMHSLLSIFKCSGNYEISSEVGAIESIISQDTFAVDNLTEKIIHLSISLSKDVACLKDWMILKEKHDSYNNIDDLKSLFTRTRLSADKDAPPDFMLKKTKEEAIILSDEETEYRASKKSVMSSSNRSRKYTSEEVPYSGPSKGNVQDGDLKYASTMASRSLKPFPSRMIGEKIQTSSGRKCDYLAGNVKHSSQAGASPLISKHGIDGDSSDTPINDQSVANISDKGKTIVKESKCQSVNISSVNTSPFAPPTTSLDPKKESDVIKQIISDDANDSSESALNQSPGGPWLSKVVNLSVPKRKVIQLQMPMNNKSGNTGKSDSTRRFKPPRLDDWYKSILDIDYFAVVGLSSVSLDKISKSLILREVPLCFESPDHYVEILRPLILEEFKAQLQNSFAEMSPDDMCCGRLSVLAVERVDDFHILRGRSDEDESTSSRGCSENDLVLLTKEPFQNSVQNVHVLGKVERRERKDKSKQTIIVMRFCLTSGSARVNRVKSLLTERSKWFICRAMNITPQLREFQALSSVCNIPMLPVILNPVHSIEYSGSGKRELGKLPQPMQKILTSSFNKSQLEAISIAIKAPLTNRTFQLSLIQGPPGTGKTRTVVAIISALLALDISRKSYTPATTKSPQLSSTSTTSSARPNLGQTAAIARAWQDAALAKQMSKDMETSSSGSLEHPARGRILICAQSNAAVDELVSRISEGLCGHDGKFYKPYLVRVGNAKTIHPNSLPFFIDTLVEDRFAEESMNQSDGKVEKHLESSGSLRATLEKILDNIRHYESKRAKLNDDDAKWRTSSDDGSSKEEGEQEISDAKVGAKLNVLYAQKRAISVELASAQSRERKAFEESRDHKNKIRRAILREAEIVVTTLSGCGGDIYGVCSEDASNNRFGNFSEQALFDAVVIDEAAQALEPATLIPLQLLKSSVARCIMVGDPKQLPATVFSNVASKFLYECSMFERLQKAGYPVVMLTEQYRMHPEISKFPSLHFYENKLQDGVTVASKSAPYHGNGYLGPYMFYDVSDGRENHGKNSATLSLYNEREVEAALHILKLLKRRYPSSFGSSKIGMITPYKSQLSMLRSSFCSTFGSAVTSDMEFNTVDGFQGREVDILILSTVRASESVSEPPCAISNSIGFVADIRRMNVALTRAKFSLWIFGNARTLQKNSHWASLIQDAKRRNLFISICRPYKSVFEKGSSSRDDSDLSADASHASHPLADETLKDRDLKSESARCVARDAGRQKVKLMEAKSDSHTGNHKEKKEMLSSSQGGKFEGKAESTRNGAEASKRMTKPFEGKPKANTTGPKGNKEVKDGGQCSEKENPVHNNKGKDLRKEFETEKKISSAKNGDRSKDIVKPNSIGDRPRNTGEDLGANADMKSLIDRAKTAQHKVSDPATAQESSLADGRKKSGIRISQHAGPEPGAKDIIASRKRQRDAAAALLPSGFISSKKPEISSKISRQRSSPSRNNPKPSKLCKGSDGKG